MEKNIVCSNCENEITTEINFYLVNWEKHISTCSNCEKMKWNYRTINRNQFELRCEWLFFSIVYIRSCLQFYTKFDCILEVFKG